MKRPRTELAIFGAVVLALMMAGRAEADDWMDPQPDGHKGLFDNTECTETRTFGEITKAFGETRMTTAGLGRHTRNETEFAVWVCLKGHPCAVKLSTAADRMCYVYGELDHKWYPWGLNSFLGLCGK